MGGLFGNKYGWILGNCRDGWIVWQ